jgi:hypothetical protein
LIAEIKERLEPKPLADLDEKADALIRRFGSAEWVHNALVEANEELAA